MEGRWTLCPMGSGPIADLTIAIRRLPTGIELAVVANWADGNTEHRLTSALGNMIGEFLDVGELSDLTAVEGALTLCARAVRVLMGADMLTHSERGWTLRPDADFPMPN